MSDLTKFILKAYLRKLLTIVGTYLLASGVISGEEQGGFVDKYLEEVLGVTLLGISAVWTFVYQRYVKDKIVTALQLPAGSNSADLEKAVEAKS